MTKIKCPDCEILVMNGRTPVHEHGCPSSHLFRKDECRWCGAEFDAERDKAFCGEECAVQSHVEPKSS